MFLKRLDIGRASDRELAVGLFCEEADYALRNFGTLPSPQGALRALNAFADDTPPEDRLLFAACERDEALALVLVERHFPDRTLATIGLLLVRPGHRHKHIGTQVIDRLSRQAKSWDGIKTWQLSVVQSNTTGLYFWERCGFHVMRERVFIPGLIAPAAVLQRPVHWRGR